jgi:adenosyl cobinamide kinase/adenosyl cobinamide phosphate guanylyltransferase
MPFTLLLGGARAGKSALAVEMAARAGSPVVVVATAEARDEEMAERIRAHRAARPEAWTTIEAPVDVRDAVASLPDDAFVLLDCLTLWVANAFERGASGAEIEAEARAVASILADRARSGVVVSNEVGLGVVPANALARRYRDALGRVNAAFAERAERAYLVVAGRGLPLHEVTPA